MLQTAMNNLFCQFAEDELMAAKSDYEQTIVAPAGDFAETEKPFDLFEDWFAEAEAHEVNDPNGMAVATVDETGLPNVRMVLLKGLDQAEAGESRGFVFYTNFESAKGRELLANGKVALLFHWKSLRRQIRIRGTARPGLGRGGECLFCQPCPRQQDRCLGLAAVAPTRQPVRPGEGRGEIHCEVQHRRYSEAGVLVGFFVSFQLRWSSGTIDHFGCTNGSYSGVRILLSSGRRRGFFHRLPLVRATMSAWPDARIEPVY